MNPMSWPCDHVCKPRCILQSTLFWALVKSAQGIPRWVPLLNQHHRGLDLPVLLAAGVQSSPDLHQIFTRKLFIKDQNLKNVCQIPLRQMGSLFFPIQIASGLIQSEEWFWYFNIWAITTWWRMTPGSFSHVVLFWYHSRHIQLHIYTRALQILYIIYHIRRTTDIYFLSFFGNSGLNDAAMA